MSRPSARTVGRKSGTVVIPRIRDFSAVRNSPVEKDGEREPPAWGLSEIRGQTIWTGQTTLAIGIASWRKRGRLRMNPCFMFPRHANLASRKSRPSISLVPAKTLCFCGENSVRRPEESAFLFQSVSEGTLIRSRNEKKGRLVEFRAQIRYL